MSETGFTAYKEENRDQMLHREANRLVDASGKPVLLTGVNCASLEWLCNPERLPHTVEVACDEWKANLIRLPLSQDKWFGFGADQEGADESGERYRAMVDGIVERVAARRKYILLDLHRSNCGSWGEFISGGMADMNALVFWKALAIRYRNHPNVLFGLYNEPFRVSWDIWRNGGEITTLYEQSDVGNQIMFDKSDREDLQEAVYPVPGTQRLIDNVRACGADNLVVVSGLDWGYELDGLDKGYDLKDDKGNGILLDAHVYPWKKLDEWDRLVTVMADRYPILIGECGHYGEDVVVHEGPQRLPSGEWVPRFLRWVEEHGYHIAAWDFHDTAGPSLIRDLQDYEPTPFWGVYYKAFLDKRNGRNA